MEEELGEEKKGDGKLLLNLFLFIIFVVLLLAAGFFLYKYYPRAAEVLNIQVGNIGIDIPAKQVNASSELKQFVPNMRFNHNSISYFISSNCDSEKQQRFTQALDIIHSEVGIISFYQTGNQEISDIELSCSQESLQTEKNVFVAGEGGPTKYINLSIYSVILKGNVVLYQKSQCGYPITELHELFHVSGFDHINNKSLIMYPYVDCKQIIPPELIKKLKELYSQEPLAELYFVNASAVKSGIYLNFSVEIRNEGLIDANNIFLDVNNEEGNTLKSFNLDNIGFGSGQTFTVSYLKLNSPNVRNIEFIIRTEQKEFSKENNVLKASI
jgi:hypothetical protein